MSLVDSYDESYFPHAKKVKKPAKRDNKKKAVLPLFHLGLFFPPSFELSIVEGKEEEKEECSEEEVDREEEENKVEEFDDFECDDVCFFDYEYEFECDYESDYDNYDELGDHYFEHGDAWERAFYGNRKTLRRRDRHQNEPRFDKKRYVHFSRAAAFHLHTRRQHKEVSYTPISSGIMSREETKSARYVPAPRVYVPAPRAVRDDDLEAAIRASLPAAPVVRGPREYSPQEAARMIRQMQNREITPEDYELLLILDESVKKKTVEKSVIDSLPEFVWKNEKNESPLEIEVVKENEVPKEEKEEESKEEKEGEDEEEKEEEAKEEEAKEAKEEGVKEEGNKGAEKEGEKEEEEEGESCRICLMEFEDGDVVCKLRCQHLFHKPCIGQWLSANSTVCPLDGLEVM